MDSDPNKKTESPVIKNSGSTHLTRPTKAGSPLAILLDTYVRATSTTGMSREGFVIGSMVIGSNGLFHLYYILINGIYWGYNPFTTHLLTSRDIQGGLIVG